MNFRGMTSWVWLPQSVSDAQAGGLEPRLWSGGLGFCSHVTEGEFILCGLEEGMV